MTVPLPPQVSPFTTTLSTITTKELIVGASGIEVGENCASFFAGLKAALREDPDIILVGEMRDAETIEMALAAAETGHLVLTTLHTANVIQAVDRMMQYFPSEQQQQIRLELANCFEGIIAQKLFPKKREYQMLIYENGKGNIEVYATLEELK